jgi:hypothetical protein
MMSTDQPAADPPTAADPRPRRKNPRLRALFAIAALSFGLYVFVRLDRSVAEWFGPVGEGIHDLFNQNPDRPVRLTAASRHLKQDVEALGGLAGISVRRRGLLGTIGQTEWVSVTFQDSAFDDAALARLAETHGGRIGALFLENTGVTDAGLKSLGAFTMLRHLHIRNFPMRPGTTVTPPKITDAGLVHLKGLDQLWSLDLSDLPITDAGLEAIKDLPELMSLHLSRTKVEGHGLSKLKSLPRLSDLYLDHGAMSEDGLIVLTGATTLQYLSLDGVPLSEKALPYLKAIPQLNVLEITGCGLLDEEVDDLKKSRPGLRIKRQ